MAKLRQAERTLLEKFSGGGILIPSDKKQLSKTAASLARKDMIIPIRKEHRSQFYVISDIGYTAIAKIPK